MLASYRQDSFIHSLRLSPDERSFLAVVWDDRRVMEWPLSARGGPPDRTIELDGGNPGTVDHAADGTFLHATGQGGRCVAGT